MPRTTTLDYAGCPPLRAFTFDVLGLNKVVEARDKEGGLTEVVERWCEPDSTKCCNWVSSDFGYFDLYELCDWSQSKPIIHAILCFLKKE
ncbi:hypothetical protein FNV43_RR00410 [Rhamnella rubrinervis]|uniref:Uncharacterized protein n=1 Tax=Rhamnella rubrinervis TaxID=2594499 RepID=A0A8K0MRZ6_9ROSA|nr:hypothetical protein FNV43_RR00410 [Rhamnella rubrinervis]